MYFIATLCYLAFPCPFQFAMIVVLLVLGAVISVLSLSVLFFIYYRIVGLREISDVEKKALFITGCDTGFGNMLALRCLKRGMPVFAGCFTAEGMIRLTNDAKGLPGTLRAIQLDVSQDESVAKAAEIVEKECVRFGGLHGVVNNAGTGVSTFGDDFMTVKDYKTVLDVNTFGPIRVVHALKHLVKRTKGRIVTVSSMSARVPCAGMGPYSTSKAAVSAYCDCLRQEVANFGVSVSIIEPGFFKTPIIDPKLVKDSLNQVWENAPERAREEHGREYFLKCVSYAGSTSQRMASSRLDAVVDAMFHALFSQYPRPRYQIGYDSVLFLIPFTYLPTYVRDTILKIGGLVTGMPRPEKAIQKYEELRKVDLKENGCAHSIDASKKAM